ncbi:unnamed protein product, partial [Tetraodon nigroviridis]
WVWKQLVGEVLVRTFTGGHWMMAKKKQKP